MSKKKMRKCITKGCKNPVSGAGRTLCMSCAKPGYEKLNDELRRNGVL